MEIVKDVVENNPQVIHEDSDVLVINKPAGLMVHGDGRSEEKTLSDWLIERSPEIENVGEPWTNPEGLIIPRPGIVHRLDRDTSGVMIIAKTQESFEYLKEQFKERKAHKQYDALVYGQPKEDSGLIDKPIGRSAKDFRRWSAQPGARGEKREAQTKWTVLKRGTDPETGEAMSHISAFPRTGRTHQIRVHLKAIHLPVVCDSLYAPGRPCPKSLGRLALHARALQIEMPNGEKKTFEAPLPDTLANCIESLSE